MLGRSVIYLNLFGTGSGSLVHLLTFSQIMERTPCDKIVHELEIKAASATGWTQFVRETLIDYLENNSESFGGPGVIVEIGESKFWKRKYSRGHCVEAHWVLEGRNKCFWLLFSTRRLTH